MYHRHTNTTLLPHHCLNYSFWLWRHRMPAAAFANECDTMGTKISWVYRKAVPYDMPTSDAHAANAIFLLPLL